MTGLSNMICLYITYTISVEDILNRSRKSTLDYIVVLVVCITWFRFFSFFLIIRKISKLLITLVVMLKNTISFFFLISCVLILSATAFTMRFDDNF